MEAGTLTALICSTSSGPWMPSLGRIQSSQQGEDTTPGFEEERGGARSKSVERPRSNSVFGSFFSCSFQAV